ncbi:polysaccharide biosynthesis protein [Escherichia coli]|nr:polysaccharide biosynthesis protein [Escherichia coli]
MSSHFLLAGYRQRRVAIVGGIALLPFLSHSLGLDDQSFWLAALYCTLIPSMASSTPTGILRAVDRFDLIAVQQATKPFLRAAGSVVAWYFDFGFAGFVIAWYVSNLVAAPCTGGLPRANYAAEISITPSN